jgi:hypothetical protein
VVRVRCDVRCEAVAPVTRMDATVAFVVLLGLSLGVLLILDGLRLL